MTVVVTGGAGFIGSALVRMLVSAGKELIVNLDKLTYAGNLESLATVSRAPTYRFERVDIGDAKEISRVLHEYAPRGIIHLAAESHVDRSIDSPADFVQTNVLGTLTLLRAAQAYWDGLRGETRDSFRLVHVSTDEVFGSLESEGRFTEDSPYRPNSPYSASKAGSDHLVRAWHHTYGLPTLTSNCSNNYGPCQFPEKLVPLMILNGVEGKPLPIYGRGENVRDWLYVDDHARALVSILNNGTPGESYLVGGNYERRNIDVVRTLCALLDELAPDPAIGSHERLIEYVSDRPGHDHRYAIDASKIARELGWRPCETFDSGIRKTVKWYLDNREWWQRVRSGVYRGERLGRGTAI